MPSLAALKDLDCILFGGLLGCRSFPWVLGGAPGLLGIPLVGPRPSQRDLGFLWVAVGDSWGVLGLPAGAPGGPPGGLGAVLGGLGSPFGGPGGAFGRPWGGRGAPSETTFAKQAALQNHWFYFMKWYILLARGVLGDPGRGKFAAKRGAEQVNRNRGAPNDPKTKRNGAVEERKRPQ